MEFTKVFNPLIHRVKSMLDIIWIKGYKGLYIEESKEILTCLYFYWRITVESNCQVQFSFTLNIHWISGNISRIFFFSFCRFSDERKFVLAISVKPMLRCYFHSNGTGSGPNFWITGSVQYIYIYIFLRRKKYMQRKIITKIRGMNIVYINYLSKTLNYIIYIIKL